MACQLFLKNNDGFKMPAVGLGTWRAPEVEVETAINEALEAGYRHIDCAPVYHNQTVIGQVLKSWFDSGKLSRNELFITTKLPPTRSRPSSVEISLRKSLKELQLDYLDLFLIHVPLAFIEREDADEQFPIDDDGNVIADPDANFVDTYKAMEEMVKKGLTKYIGISNFNEQQIQRILDNCTIKPANLQIELHLYLQQPKLLDFCRENDITVTAYSPFASLGIDLLYQAVNVEKEFPNVLKNEKALKIAEKYNKTSAQVLLRYWVQKNVAVIPKSTNPGRLRENINVFDFKLNDDEMKELTEEDCNNRVCDFKFLKGVTDHPEYPF